jgi:hypothetical protein
MKLQQLSKARKFVRVDIVQFFKIHLSSRSRVEKLARMQVWRPQSEIKAMGGD